MRWKRLSAQWTAPCACHSADGSCPATGLPTFAAGAETSPECGSESVVEAEKSPAQVSSPVHADSDSPTAFDAVRVFRVMSGSGADGCGG